ncbi:MAG: hydroxyacid dehydrogenase [Polyangiaceae bacterium]|nr:hydroxyacid dehydrogenase [Polyangiaceae bacterium]
MMLFVDIDRDWAAPLLAQRLSGLGRPLHATAHSLERALGELGERCRQVEVLSPFITSPVGPDELEQLPALRLICTRSTGFDHIDLAAVHARGICVCNVPVYGDNTVAEHTFALILSLSRRLRRTYDRVGHDELRVSDLEGFDLRGKTLGIIGTGHIGLRVAQIARGFSMRVVAYDPYEQPLLADVVGFSYLGFDSVLGEADIVTLHCPYRQETHHLLDTSAFAAMKRGALLINTARGGLVDTSALVDALHSGRIGGAGLDVLEHESMILDEDHARAGLMDMESMRATVLNHHLLSRDNVVFTPHVGFNSREANERIFLTTAESIGAFYAGTPINRVFPPERPIGRDPVGAAGQGER